jgi:hypothetical protein
MCAGHLAGVEFADYTGETGLLVQTGYATG